jgi:Pyruvate/2-oxoacid:ferredoxin oxidoreductase delta subunit
MQYFCNGCEECLNVCPNSAIKLIPKSSIQSS